MSVPSAIEIVPLRGRAPERAELVRLARGVQSAFGVPVRIGLARDLGTPAPPTDAPLSSNAIIDALTRRGGPADVWYLAVTDAELTAPGRTFVFGEATLGGRWAVVSSAHLDSPGTPHEIASERLLKEAVHELGHLAGLSHCATGNCVMVPSSDSSHVDEKPLAFCASCGSRIDG